MTAFRWHDSEEIGEWRNKPVISPSSFFFAPPGDRPTFGVRPLIHGKEVDSK